MDRTQLIARTRAMTRDFSNATFREADIISFIDEGIDRFKQVIPEMSGLAYLALRTDIPSLIPSQYQHLLAVYASARCYGQDERFYQATNLMNEFEIKLEELQSRINNGEISITTVVNGITTTVTNDNEMDFVETKSYYGDYHTGSYDDDIDLGVGGGDSISGIYTS